MLTSRAAVPVPNTFFGANPGKPVTNFGIGGYEQGHSGFNHYQGGIDYHQRCKSQFLAGVVNQSFSPLIGLMDTTPPYLSITVGQEQQGASLQITLPGAPSVSGSEDQSHVGPAGGFPALQQMEVQPAAAGLPRTRLPPARAKVVRNHVLRALVR